MSPRKIDPFLLNFITLGIICGFVVLTVVQIYQHIDITTHFEKRQDIVTKQDSKRLFEYLDYQFEVIRADIDDIRSNVTLTTSQSQTQDGN